MSHTTPREYVALPAANEVSRADFWLCIWIRRDMQVKALEAHIDQDQVWDQAGEVLRYALMTSRQALIDQADVAVDTLHESGGLLFAFAETTRPGNTKPAHDLPRFKKLVETFDQHGFWLQFSGSADSSELDDEPGPDFYSATQRQTGMTNIFSTLGEADRYIQLVGASHQLFKKGGAA